MLYISSSRLDRETEEAEIESIAIDAAARNAAAGVTGAMLFTGTHFAQILEGPEDIVRATMMRIGHDRRHDEVTIVARGPVGDRRFARWSMAYAGRSTFAETIVTRALSGATGPDDYATDRLTRLLLELSRASGRPPSAR